MSDNSEWARLVELNSTCLELAGIESERLRLEILRLQSELSEAKARVTPTMLGPMSEAPRDGNTQILVRINCGPGDHAWSTVMWDDEENLWSIYPGDGSIQETAMDGWLDLDAVSEAKARERDARDGALREAREICQSELEDCETEAERQRCLSIATACLHMMSEEGDDPDEDALIKPMSKESYAECMRIATIADAQPAAEARANAIEECAKVAEGMWSLGDATAEGHGGEASGKAIARAIRSLNGGKTE